MHSVPTTAKFHEINSKHSYNNIFKMQKRFQFKLFLRTMRQINSIFRNPALTANIPSLVNKAKEFLHILSTTILDYKKE